VTTTDTSRRPRRYRLARLGTVPILLAGFLSVPALAPGVAQASPCEYGGGYYHYYAVDQSGSGTNKGTGAWMQTWSRWSLDGHPSSDVPFADEAVWVLDHNNINDALEVGFATGYGGGTGTLTNNMYPYVTVNNDQNPSADESDFQGVSLPTNTMIWNSATSDGSSSWGYIDNTQYAYFANYGVSTPRENYEQSEVNYHDIWMGGGSGSTMTLYYQTPSNQWLTWGGQDAYTDWIDYSKKPAKVSNPAGYGYYSNPASGSTYKVTEGGYGQGC